MEVDKTEAVDAEEADEEEEFEIGSGMERECEDAWMVDDIIVEAEIEVVDEETAGTDARIEGAEVEEERTGVWAEREDEEEAEGRRGKEASVGVTRVGATAEAYDAGDLVGSLGVEIVEEEETEGEGADDDLRGKEAGAE